MADDDPLLFHRGVPCGPLAVPVDFERALGRVAALDRPVPGNRAVRTSTRELRQLPGAPLCMAPLVQQMAPPYTYPTQPGGGNGHGTGREVSNGQMGKCDMGSFRDEGRNKGCLK